jgi:hypothetical protein
VPIWKALSINGLRHGVRSNLLILLESQLCQCDTHLAARMQARLRPARHLVALIWLARNRQETDLASASADIALALAADAADGGAINPTRKMRAISESLLRQYRCRSLDRRARRFIVWERRYSGPCSRPAEEGADQSVGTSIPR